MTARQKVGVGLLVGALLSAIFGVVRIAVPVDPGWLGPLSQIVTLVAGALGFVLERKPPA